jgi:two-component system LytT family sensor kinase
VFWLLDDADQKVLRLSPCFHVRLHRRYVGTHHIIPILRTQGRIGFMEAESLSASKIARSYLWSILIWLSLALVAAGEDSFTLMRGLYVPFRILLLLDGAWLLTAALLTPPLFAIVRRYPIVHSHRAGRMAAYLFATLPYLAVSACLRSVLLPPWDSDTHQFTQRSVHSLVGNMHVFSFQLWCYLAILVVAHAYHGFQRAKALDLERAELQQALTASELQMLKSQLQPHYLFNTLHGIVTLIDSDRAKAKASVLKLSSLLRASLEYGNSDLISFAEELKFVEAYLELEQMRLADRLQITWDIDFETREMFVPQLILQPLVENAILHGIACCREGGWIQIVSRKIGDRAELEIRNSVGGKRQQGLGLGHRNTTARIRHLYANEGAFVFRIGPDGVAVATLTFPVFLSQKEGKSPEYTSSGATL